MSVSLFYSLLGLCLFGLGLQAFFSRPLLLQKILALNVCSSGVFLVLISSGFRPPAAPDPVPHALVLTGIVIAVSTTAFGLALAARLRPPTAEAPPSRRGSRGGTP